MTKPARPIATVAASLTAIAIVGLFAVQMRYVATSMDLVSVPQAQAAALQSAPASPATDADGTVVVEYCSEAVAARAPRHPAGRTSTRLAFDDAWFSTDAGSYNHDLATTCAVLSAVCNSESRFYSSDGAEDPYAEHALASLGFQHVRTESYALRSTVIDQVAALVNGTHGTSAYTLAAKRLPSGDTLAFVGVRGTYGAEWLSNFSIFDAHGRPDHEGYRIAEREVADALASYLREIGADPSRTRVLATGHSRGGAIANLLAAEIADRANGPDALARADGVYAYTFAAPGTTRSKAHDAAAYRGIFNIVNPSDIVPQLPLSSWGYGRYGTTVALPGVGDPRFEAALAAMRQAYERNTGHADYCGPDALASLAAFGSKAAKLLPTPDSLLNPAGAFSALQQLAAIDAGSALLAHYPDTYIAWMQAVDESALSFARAGARESARSSQGALARRAFTNDRQFVLLNTSKNKSGKLAHRSLRFSEIPFGGVMRLRILCDRDSIVNPANRVGAKDFVNLHKGRHTLSKLGIKKRLLNTKRMQRVLRQPVRHMLTGERILREHQPPKHLVIPCAKSFERPFR